MAQLVIAFQENVSQKNETGFEKIALRDSEICYQTLLAKIDKKREEESRS